MRMAVAVCRGRVSPVFDTARRVLVLDVENEIIQARQEQDLETDEPTAKVSNLAGLGVQVLICGAISRPLADLIESGGIRLHPFVAGEPEEVISAFLAGSLSNPRLAMPGCCGQRGRFGGQGRGRGCGGFRGGRQGRRA